VKRNRIVVLAALLLAGAVVAVVIAGTQTGRAGKDTDAAEAATAPAPDVSGAAAKAEPVGVSGRGLTAIQKASRAGKYLFAFFHKEETAESRKAQEVFDAAVKKAGDRAESVKVSVVDPSEKAIVDKYQVMRAPMPLVLVLAPNGAITGGFPKEFTEEQLLGAFVSPGMEKCLKALQEGKLLVLCAQNESTKSNDAAMAGAEAFRADERFARFTEIVLLNPADEAEGRLAEQLGIEPNATEAVTVLLAPPGSVIGKFKGAVGKEKLEAALKAATSGGCGTGGGSGGCGPRGCN